MTKPPSKIEKKHLRDTVRCLTEENDKFRDQTEKALLAVKRALDHVESLDSKIGGFVIGVMGVDGVRREMQMREHLKTHLIIEELKKFL